MVQYGFFFDQSRCHGCNICQVACKSWNMLPPGPEKWMRVYQWEKGSFPNVRVHTAAVFCYQCENPVCVDAADGAMYKEEKYGAVLIDPDKATSASMRKAFVACPYGAIAFDSDAPDAKASMCTMCIDRLEQDKLPVCVESCPQRAFEFGPFDEIQKKYGANRDLEDLPDSNLAKPAIIFKPHNPRKQVVPYDANKALTLLQNREGLPQVFADKSDVLDIPADTVGRGKLNLHAKSTKELMLQTQDDTA